MFVYASCPMWIGVLCIFSIAVVPVVSDAGSQPHSLISSTVQQQYDALTPVET